MILILSTDADVSTGAVMEWLEKLQLPYFRLNDNDIFRYPINVFFDEQHTIQFEIHYQDRIIRSTDISVVWFRKFGFFKDYEGYFSLEKALGSHYANNDFSSESKSLLNLIRIPLRDKKWLCNPRFVGLNKMFVLSRALTHGIRIPESLLTNTREGIQDKNNNGKRFITKSLGDLGFTSIGKEYLLPAYTIDITKEINDLPVNFFPSLFQEKIEKQFELRIFYLDGKFYSMAIFSQKNETTSTDFRKYDRNLPNRFVPYQLPSAIEEKLHMLMQDLGLNTGSIDMIYTEEKEYVFLEVNPCGQFGMVSMPCNYPIERDIAFYLKKQYHAATTDQREKAYA